MRVFVRFFLGTAIFCSASVVSAATPNVVGQFSEGVTRGWEAGEFNGIAKSRYRLVDLDDRRVLHGRCDASASVYGLEKQIDLNATPVMNWSWRVDSVYPDIDERTRSGDDYVARVYAVVDGGILKWRTRAINYVWASKEPAGEAFPNPFRDQAMMVPVQSGTGGTGKWHQESRNVKADFKRYYDKNVDYIDGIAIMTDCDNHGGTGEAWFGDIYFTAE